MGRVVSAAFPITSFYGMNVDRSLLSSSANYYSYESRYVEFLAFHYTGNPSDTPHGNANYFHTGSRGASAHFFVNETECNQSVALHNAAWAVGGTTRYKHPSCRNKNSISIEMCCSGNYRMSDKTIENGAKLGAALCRYLGITADKVDTYVVRHYDVWNKQCPAQWASNNNAGWVAFKERIKQLLRESDNNEEELTMSQYTELLAKIEKLEDKVNSLSSAISTIGDYAGVKYRYVDNNLPEWAHNVMQKLINAGVVKGDGDGFAMSTSDLRLFTILDRVGAIDNNLPFRTVEELPEWAVDSVTKLIKAGVILGEGDDNLGLSMQVVKMIVFLDRAGVISV